MFEEIAFDISVTGKYLDIIIWLRKVEDELHPMVVKKFKMAGSNDGLQTNLRIVSYRPASSPL